MPIVVRHDPNLALMAEIAARASGQQAAMRAAERAAPIRAAQERYAMQLQAAEEAQAARGARDRELFQQRQTLAEEADERKIAADKARRKADADEWDRRYSRKQKQKMGQLQAAVDNIMQDKDFGPPGQMNSQRKAAIKAITQQLRGMTKRRVPKTTKSSQIITDPMAPGYIFHPPDLKALFLEDKKERKAKEDREAEIQKRLDASGNWVRNQLERWMQTEMAGIGGTVTEKAFADKKKELEDARAEYDKIYGPLTPGPGEHLTLAGRGTKPMGPPDPLPSQLSPPPSPIPDDPSQRVDFWNDRIEDAGKLIQRARTPQEEQDARRALKVSQDERDAAKQIVREQGFERAGESKQRLLDNLQRHEATFGKSKDISDAIKRTREELARYRKAVRAHLPEARRTGTLDPKLAEHERLRVSIRRHGPTGVILDDKKRRSVNSQLKRLKDQISEWEGKLKSDEYKDKASQATIKEKLEGLGGDVARLLVEHKIPIGKEQLKRFLVNPWFTLDEKDPWYDEIQERGPLYGMGRGAYYREKERRGELPAEKTPEMYAEEEAARGLERARRQEDLGVEIERGEMEHRRQQEEIRKHGETPSPLEKELLDLKNQPRMERGPAGDKRIAEIEEVLSMDPGWPEKLKRIQLSDKHIDEQLASARKLIADDEPSPLEEELLDLQNKPKSKASNKRIAEIKEVLAMDPTWPEKQKRIKKRLGAKPETLEEWERGFDKRAEEERRRGLRPTKEFMESKETELKDAEAHLAALLSGKEPYDSEVWDSKKEQMQFLDRHIKDSTDKLKSYRTNYEKEKKRKAKKGARK